MYSCEDRIRAVKLYIKLDKRTSLRLPFGVILWSGGQCLYDSLLASVLRSFWSRRSGHRDRPVYDHLLRDRLVDIGLLLPTKKGRRVFSRNRSRFAVVYRGGIYSRQHPSPNLRFLLTAVNNEVTQSARKSTLWAQSVDELLDHNQLRLRCFA